ncbi:MAG: NUDIX domain-containing protein, partial [Pseudomonadota bacterium]
MRSVSGPGSLDATVAILPKHRVCTVAGHVVPALFPDPQATAEGTLWRDLSPDQVARITLYEGAFGYVLTPVTVRVDGVSVKAQCFLPPPDIAASDDGWVLAAWEAQHLAPAVLAAEEVFAMQPLPDAAALRSMWPMIEARAWSKCRAATTPATTRYTPSDKDFVTHGSGPPMGRFFRFQSVDIAHRQFGGGTSPVMTREAFIGVDAAMILPYDPMRDRVLLVEQARVGPYMRQDPNPWMLEPIAGIVDARETPEAAALREAAEEAALQVVRLENAGSFYVSPGATTDYFYTYVGLCDLPQTTSYFGGLADEAEDLRLHPLSFEDALGLCDSGEIQT